MRAKEVLEKLATQKANANKLMQQMGVQAKQLGVDRVQSKL